MKESAKLIEALKRILKSKGVTYSRLAKHLGLSESSVKRIFSEGSFTLVRLEQICEVAGVTLAQLTKVAEAGSSSEATFLDEPQEKALAEDPKLFAFFHLLVNGQTPEQIARGYRVSEPEKLRILGKLSRLRLLEFLPQKGVRVLFGRNVKWLPRGPLIRMYLEPIRDEFFRSAFEKDREMMRFVLGRLSPQSFAQLKKKMQKLLQEYEELSELDQELPRGQAEETALLVAYRPWSFSRFQVLSHLEKRQ